MKKLLFASAMALVLVSCKKDKDEDTAPAISMESLAGTYTLGSITVKVGNGPEENITDSQMEPCEKDDKLTLSSNGTFSNQDAGTTCDPTTAGTGTWSLTSNNTKIVMDGEESTIQSFNNGVLKIGETDNSTGVAITYTVTMNKQ